MPIKLTKPVTRFVDLQPVETKERITVAVTITPTEIVFREKGRRTRYSTPLAAAMLRAIRDKAEQDYVRRNGPRKPRIKRGKL